MPRQIKSAEGLLRTIFPDMPPGVLISPFILEDGEEIFLADALDRALNTLPWTTGERDHAPRPRLKEMLECYYGLSVHEPMTAPEIAAELEISERSVRGAIKNAVRTLGHPSNSQRQRLRRFFVSATAAQDQALSE